RKNYDKINELKRKKQSLLHFTAEDFNERWMNRVIRRAYGREASPSFDAMIDEFLMKQRQETIEAEETGVIDKEKKETTSNVLLGAINDYLIDIHGPSVPRIYTFPLKDARITDSIKATAAVDASSLLV